MNMSHLEFAANWAWQTSLGALPLIALMLAATLALRKGVFTPIRYMLGLLIVGRLLMPISPSSPFSIQNLFDGSDSPTASAVPGPGIQLDAPAISIAAISESISISTHPSTFDWKAALSLIWMAGVLALLAWVFIQHARVRRWMQPGRKITNGLAHETLAKALADFGLRRPIAVYVIPEISVPAVYGAFRPAILLPTSNLQSADAERLRMIFLHEVAHIKRWDVLTRWLMVVARSLHWFNPFAWLAVRRLAAEQELLCDNDVLRLLKPNEQRDYADTLLSLASMSSRGAGPTAIAISSGFKQMKERMIMIQKFKPATRRWLLVGAAPLAALIALVTFTGAVKKPAPSKIETAEAQKGRSRAELLSKMQAEQLIDTLQRELDSMTARIRSQQEEMDNLRDRYGFQTTAEGNDILPSETLITLQRERARAEQEFWQMNQLYQSLKPMSRSQLRQTLPTARHDEALDRYLSERAKVQQELVLLDDKFSPEHPEIKKTVALLKNIDAQIEDRIDGIMAGLDTLVNSRKSALDLASKNVEEAKTRDSEIRRNSRGYFQIKRDVESLQKIRDGIFLRLQEERLNRVIPSAKRDVTY